jgi:hypothetical protein
LFSDRSAERICTTLPPGDLEGRSSLVEVSDSPVRAPVSKKGALPLNGLTGSRVREIKQNRKLRMRGFLPGDGPEVLEWTNCALPVIDEQLIRIGGRFQLPPCLSTGDLVFAFAAQAVDGCEVLDLEGSDLESEWVVLIIE